MEGFYPSKQIAAATLEWLLGKRHWGRIVKEAQLVGFETAYAGRYISRPMHQERGVFVTANVPDRAPYRLFSFYSDIRPPTRCTRLGYQHREMVQPMVYPFHGRFCLREFAGASETEGFLSPGVRASMRYDVRIEVLAAFGVAHALWRAVVMARSFARSARTVTASLQISGDQYHTHGSRSVNAATGA